MALIDIILLVYIGYFTLWGFRKGLISAIGAIIGLIAGVIVASRYFDDVGLYLAPYIGLENNHNLAKITGFIIILFAVNYAVSLVVGIIEKMYHAVAVLPFMNLGNRVLGALLGLLQAAFTLGLIFYFTARFPFGSIVEKVFEGSEVVPLVLRLTSLVEPLIPEAVRRMQGLM